MSESSLTFYTHPQSRGGIVRWMLEETGLPYRTEVLDFDTTMKAADFLALNPMGKVPVIVHEGTVITEAAAIALYLADLAPGQALAPPVGHVERGTYYRWISFLGPLEQAMMDAMSGVKVDPKVAGYGSMERVVATLETAVAGRQYLAGDRFTAADLLMSAYLGWYMQFKLFEPGPELVRYVQLHGARPANLRANELDKAAWADLKSGAAQQANR